MARNQCDGCMAGMPISRGLHHSGSYDYFGIHMSCQRKKYDDGQWIGIATAPKTGAWIILCREGHDEVLLGYWHRTHNAWWGQGGTSGTWEKWEKASHWMPVPKPVGVK